ncbi:hypothetical protein [Corynebacterium falsenii]
MLWDQIDTPYDDDGTGHLEAPSPQAKNTVDPGPQAALGLT